MQARFERLPEAIGIRFVDPTGDHSGREGAVRWMAFVNFLRDPKNDISVVSTPPSNMGEYRVYILEKHLSKVLSWMEEYGVIEGDGFVTDVREQ